MRPLIQFLCIIQVVFTDTEVNPGLHHFTFDARQLEEKVKSLPLFFTPDAKLELLNLGKMNL